MIEDFLSTISLRDELDLSPKSASLALAERLKERNSSALIELARSRNSYLSKASCKQRKQEIRGCTDTS